jgi:hypothetical protein
MSLSIPIGEAFTRLHYRDLCLPSCGFASFSSVISAGDAEIGTIAISPMIGAMTMAFPVIMLKPRSRSYFLQSIATKFLAKNFSGCETIEIGPNIRFAVPGGTWRNL